MHRQAIAIPVFSTLMFASGCDCTPERPNTEVSTSEGANSDETPRPGRKVEALPDPCQVTRRDPPASLCPSGRGIVRLPPDVACPDLSGMGWVWTRRWNHCVYAKPTENELAKLTIVDGGVEPDVFASILQTADASSDELASRLTAALPPDQAFELARDCKTWSAGSPDRQELAEQFVNSLASPERAAEGERVTVAVIDTAPTTPSQGTALHGRLIAAIVGHVARVDWASNCADQSICVRNFVGLPRSLDAKGDEQIDLERGGYYGYQSDIAAAIAAALDAWQPPKSKRPGKLILNLSFGWDPETGADSSLVAAAIAEARCRGALVFAAAGNRHPLACPSDTMTGPGYFAAWAAPSREQCEAGTLPVPLSTATTNEPARPLVYAVNAVDRQGKPLASNRVAAMPIPAAGFEALGLEAVVANPWALAGNQPFLGPQSGTSVATAVVSGNAAVVWANDPTLDADAVAQALRSPTGAPIGLLDNDANVLAKPVPDSGKEQPATELEGVECRDSCLGIEETARFAPGTTFYSTPLSTWTVPQPDDVLCSICKIEKNKIILSLVPTHPSPLVGVSVVLRNASAAETIYLGSPTIPDEPGNVSISVPELCTVGSSNAPPTSAWVDFVFSGKNATGDTFYYSLGNAIPIASTCSSGPTG